VTRGALEILAAADDDALARVRPLLDALGQVRPVGDVATAAALKLVANSSLAGAVLGLRDSLRQGEALGLPRPQVLDVLELGQLGDLVARKRPFLIGRPAPAEFTIGALAKDMALLADASKTPLRSAAELADSPAALDADIALAAPRRRSATTCSPRCAPTSAGTPQATRLISARRSCRRPTSRACGTGSSCRGASMTTARSSTGSRN
jgi:hypothetical protein